MKLDTHKLVSKREMKGMSQQKLAKTIGVATPTISRAERGFGVRPATALLIANALETPLEDLVEKSGAAA